MLVQLIYKRVSQMKNVNSILKNLVLFIIISSVNKIVCYIKIMLIATDLDDL